MTGGDELEDLTRLLRPRQPDDGYSNSQVEANDEEKRIDYQRAK
jgi:hypothetical protein